MVGSSNHFDPVDHLQGLVGRFGDEKAVRAQVETRYRELVEAQPVLPGVADRIAEAQRLGLRLGVASSSRRPWVDGHLARLGLRDAFTCLACRGDPPGLRGKPNPDTYEAAVACLGVSPAGTLAIEDSPHGIRAAKAAGLHCLAVPNGLTSHLDLSEADVTAVSLAEVSLEDFL